MADNSIINKATMVQYMMISNKIIESCLKADDTFDEFNELVTNLMAIKIKSNGTKNNIDALKVLLNTTLKNINTNSNKYVQEKVHVLFLIIQLCLDKRSEYTPYKKNLIHNIVFNILKKENISNLETFFICGIIRKIINIELNLSHLDTLVYILDKLFMYKFPSITVPYKNPNNRDNIITLTNKNKKKENIPIIYNRKRIYNDLKKITNADFKKYLAYYDTIKTNNNENIKKSKGLP